MNPDGAELLTREWLLSIGFAAWTSRAVEYDCWDGLRMSLSQMMKEPSEWMFNGWREEPHTNISSATLRSRGDLRRMLAALCLKEGDLKS